MTQKEAREREAIKKSMPPITEQVSILRKYKALYGNEINCDSIISRLTGNKFVCPKCSGTGKVTEKYKYVSPYAKDPDWEYEWREREITCDLCKGQGYTDVEYKPKMVQQGWTT